MKDIGISTVKENVECLDGIKGKDVLLKRDIKYGSNGFYLQKNSYQ